MVEYRITEPLQNGVKIVQFPALDAFSGELRHGFSTRYGGVSEGMFSTMNLGFGRGDSDDNVRENFRRLFAAIGIPEGSAVFTKQTHTVNVRVATGADRGIGLEREIPYDDVDGLVTDVPGVALSVFCSDCVPIFFYDPVRRAIGTCHAGWRGTVGRIGPECFEVGEEVADAFSEEFGESVILRKPGVKPHVDLWEANAAALADAGLVREHISIAGLCTMCEPEMLFSHRASEGKRGSNAGFLMMSEA